MFWGGGVLFLQVSVKDEDGGSASCAFVICSSGYQGVRVRVRIQAEPDALSPKEISIGT